MSSTLARTSLVGGWFATVAVGIGLSVAAGASLSTSALLLGLGVAPIVIMMLIARGGPSPTVAEILHSVEAKNGR